MSGPTWFAFPPWFFLQIQRFKRNGLLGHRCLSLIEKMTKSELEAYGRKFGYEVDRRETKAKIVKAVAKLK